MKLNKILSCLCALTLTITLVSGCKKTEVIEEPESETQAESTQLPIQLPDTKIEDVIWEFPRIIGDCVYYSVGVENENGVTTDELRKANIDGSDHATMYISESDVTIVSIAAGTDWIFVSLNNGNIVRISPTTAESEVIYEGKDDATIVVLENTLILISDMKALAITFDGDVIDRKNIQVSQSIRDTISDGTYLYYFDNTYDVLTTYRLDASLNETALWSFDIETDYSQDVAYHNDEPAPSYKNCGVKTMLSDDIPNVLAPFMYVNLYTVSGDWLYYGVDTAHAKHGALFHVFRCNVKTGERQYLFEPEETTERVRPSRIMFVRDEKIFFIAYNDATSKFGFYACDLDGSNQKLFSEHDE